MTQILRKHHESLEQLTAAYNITINTNHNPHLLELLALPRDPSDSPTPLLPGTQS